MSNQTQIEKIVEYCSGGRSIDGYTALLELGIQHLPGVVRNAKKKGYYFDAVRVDIIARDGSASWYKQYTLKNPERI